MKSKSDHKIISPHSNTAKSFIKIKGIVKNDHQPEKLWLLNKFSLSVSQEMHREKSGEYKYWCLGLKGESDLKPSHWQPHFISSNYLTHFSFF